MNPQISRLRTLGLLFSLLGGTLIVLGWVGTARLACVDCQLPYLLSGGATGLGLIIIGASLLVIAQLRAEGEKLTERLTALATPPDEATTDTAPAGPDDSPGTTSGSASAGAGPSTTHDTVATNTTGADAGAAGAAIGSGVIGGADESGAAGTAGGTGALDPGGAPVAADATDPAGATGREADTEPIPLVGSDQGTTESRGPDITDTAVDGTASPREQDPR